jgi:hypothetical protein
MEPAAEVDCGLRIGGHKEFEESINIKFTAKKR